MNKVFNGNKLVLASNNKGKLAELQAILEPVGVEIIPQSKFDVPSVEETGSTFVENALIKARAASLTSKLPALADDSGLAVDWLGGLPGVRSARYAGDNASDEENNRALLTAMSTCPPEHRQARFICVLAFLRTPDDPTPLLFLGSLQGEILESERGEGGFGYDPLFLVPSHGCSSAELSKETKNRISHRAQALQQFTELLQD